MSVTSQSFMQVENAMSLKLLVLSGMLLSIASAAAQADSAIVLPHRDFYPEGVAAAPNGDLYVGSLQRGEIYRIDAASRAVSLFAGTGHGLFSVIGMLVSGDGATLYACSSDPIQQFAGSYSSLVAFDIASGAMKDRYPLPPMGLCNDMAELANGDLIVSDSFSPRLLKLDTAKNMLEVWVTDPRFTGEGFNLNGVALMGDAVYAVKYNSGDLFRIPILADGRAAEPVALALPRPLKGPDGLEALPTGGLLVVEGGAGALTRITMVDGALALDTVADGFDVPTTAALHGGNAYVSESQLDHFMKMDSTEPGAFVIQIIPLGK